MNRANQILSFLLIFFLATFTLQAQEVSQDQSITKKETDLLDGIQSLFNITPDPIVVTSKPSISLLPTIGYNPSFGGVFGFNAVMGKQFGDPKNTDYSVYNLLFSYSTSGVVTLQSRHNIFRPGNSWNFQGNWQFSLYGLVDHGLGTGNTNYCFSGTEGVGIPAHEDDSLFVLRYDYLRLSEKFYTEIAHDIYVGGGINLNFYSKIEEESSSEVSSTPHSRYSMKHGFNPEKYAVNGLQLLFQYNTREHPIRAYSGIYFDLNFQINPKWLGSSKNSSIVNYDFRKYWSLSKRNPSHVLAFWHWATYKISGERPYLDLAFTGSDTYNRSGRGYTIGYFRGISYAYFETEYRYPILSNKLISGVLFVNYQTAGDDAGTKIFRGWNVGGGAGLRILFQKRSRSAVCIDFSMGECGSSGLFFGLNEVF